MKLKLYHAKWSLCSQMVRVAMEEKGLSYESNLIKLCDQYPEAENLSPEYLAINPKGIVPSLDLDGEIVTESTNIIKKLNSLSGEKDIDLWPSDVDQEKLNAWVEDTTLTDGVPLGKTLGTAIPPFSIILINFMVKKYLSFFQAIKVFWKHPLRDRGRGFLVMKFFNIQKPVAARCYKVLAKSLIEIEKNLIFLFCNFLCSLVAPNIFLYLATPQFLKSFLTLRPLTYENNTSSLCRYAKIYLKNKGLCFLSFVQYPLSSLLKLCKS